MRNFLKYFVSFILLVSSQTILAQWTIKTVPNPGNKNSYVSNPDKILTSEYVLILDSILKETEDSSGSEVAIVMLKSIGKTVPKEFATELFNYWGIGSKTSNNGLLILFIMDQRRIEFETGYGIEAILPDAKCYQIQQDCMLPRFKEGNFNQGIYDGVKIIVDIIMGRYQESPIASAPNQSINNKSKNVSTEFIILQILKFYGLLCLTLSIFFLIMFGIAILQRNYFTRFKVLRIFQLKFWVYFSPIPFLLIYPYAKYLLRKWRDTPRISAKTGKIMRKLSDIEEDKYLSSGRIQEEYIKSIDYDVWISDEPDDILILGYKRWFSQFSACPKCKFKTYYFEGDNIISEATTSHSGEGQRRYTCLNCKYSEVETYTIPQISESTSNNYSSSSYESSSSFGGSTSWGGGSSGGGGAGSSW